MSSLPFAGACYVALLCALLIALLGRFFDPIPRRSRLVLVGLLLVHLGPNLLLGRSALPLQMLDIWEPWASSSTEPSRGRGGLLHGDLILKCHPWFAEARRQWRDGQIPLWNPFAGAGQPLLANPQAEVLQPLTLLTLPLADDDTALAVRNALRIACGFVFTLLFFRRNGLGPAAADLGAAAYAGAGYLATWLSWPHATSAGLLPAVLYAVVRVDERGGRRDRLLLAASTFALVVGGHTETIGYALGAATVVALVRLWRRPAAARWAAGRSLATGIALGGAMAVVTVLPGVEMLRAGVRYAVVQGGRGSLAAAGGLFEEELTAAGRRAWGERVASRAAALVAPDAQSAGPGYRSRGVDNWIELSSGFVGSGMLVLALLACARRPRFPDELALRWLGGLGLLGIAAPFGVSALLGRFPPLLPASQHAFGRATLLIGLAICGLAAGELDRRLRDGGGWRRPLAIAVTVGLLALLASLVAGTVEPSGPERARALTAWGLQAAALLLTVALLAALHRHRERAAWLLVAVAVAEGGWFFGRHHPAYARRADFLAHPRLQALQKVVGPYRFAATGNLFPANLGMMIGAADIRTDGPEQSTRYLEVLRPMLERGLDGRRLTGEDHPLLDLLGVRAMVRGDTTRAWRIEHRGTALPLLFLPRRVERVAPGEATTAIHRIDDFAAVAVVEDGGVDPPGIGERWRGRARARIDVQRPARVTATVAVDQPRLLATSIYQDGGWRVRIDGEPVPAVTTNATFVGAWIPAGRHQVELRYAPRSLRKGALIALVCGLAALAWIAWPGARRTAP